MNAVIFATEHCPQSTQLKAMLKIGGISILERQVRILRLAGVKDIFVVAHSATEDLRIHCEALCSPKLKVHLSSADGDDQLLLRDQTDSEGQWFVCDGSSVLDDRLPPYLAQSRVDKVAVFNSGEIAKERFDAATRVNHKDDQYAFAGCAKISVETLNKVQTQDGVSTLQSVLECTLQRQPDGLVDLGDIAFYDYDLRRDDTFVWMSVRSADDNAQAKKMLLGRAQKSVLDWPAWFIHQPIEKWAVYHLCELPVTPNMITVLNMIVAFPAIWLFAQGHILAGLITALAAGIIDGLDGKLARMQVAMSKVGRLEEVSDRLYEYGWYLGISVWLASIGYGAVAYMLFCALLFLQFIEIMVGWLFKTKRGVQLDDYGPFERSFRWIGSRRNTNMWSLSPFVLAGAVYAGYWFLVLYYFLTVAFRVWRSTLHLANQESTRSS